MLPGSTFHSLSTLSLTLSTRIQWRVSCDLCTLWQRSGRAARDFALNVITLFLVESMYFDETSDEKAAKKAKREEKARAKAKVVEAEKIRLGKRRRTDDMCEDNHPSSPHLEPPSISTTILHAQFIAASLITSTVMLVTISLVTMM